MVQQRNVSDKRAVADEEMLLAGGPVPAAGAPLAGTAGDDVHPVDVEAPSLADLVANQRRTCQRHCAKKRFFPETCLRGLSNC